MIEVQGAPHGPPMASTLSDPAELPRVFHKAISWDRWRDLQEKSRFNRVLGRKTSRAGSTSTTEAIECTHCGCLMSSTASADGGAYFSCPLCLRMYSSTYDEVFRKAAGARPASRRTLAAQQLAPARRTTTTAPGQQLLPLENRIPASPSPGDERFARVKARLEAWLRRLDEQDPWYVLGVAPGTGIEKVRARFREQALVHHPDRGGDAATMRRMTRAYDAIRVQLATGRVATGERRHIQAPAALAGEDEG